MSQRNKNIRKNRNSPDLDKFDKYDKYDKHDRYDKHEKKSETHKMTYYEVLDVNENAALPEIKKQFRKYAIDYHPDNKTTGDASVFALVARAYECLSDTNKRADYDRMLMIERKTRKSNYLSQKKAFEDFINAQENEIDDESEKIARGKFNLEFAEIDNKRGFDRKKYNEEISNPLTQKDTRKRLDDLMLLREQDDIELTQRKIFNDDSWNPDKFNELFEKKFKTGKRLEQDIIKYSGGPSAFNEIGGASFVSFDKNDLYEDDDDCPDGSNYISLKEYDDDEIHITDEDIEELKRMKGSSSYRGHTSDRGRSYQQDMERRMREIEAERDALDNRKLNDYETDIKKGYGFMHDVGLTGREFDWDDEDVDDETFKKLTYRNGTRKTKIKKH